MTASELIESVMRAGGTLTLKDDGGVRYRLPKDAVHMVGELKAHKPELVELLRRAGGRIAALPLADSLRTYKPEIVALLQSRTEQEAESAPESDALGLWMLARCVYRQGYEDSAGISCLWIDFCEWAVTADSVPCTRRTFERLLADAGFRCADGMAAGLLLRVDLEAVLCFQNPHREPAPQRTRKASR